jgi:V/A-type H+-transporting ATPase subunit D
MADDAPSKTQLLLRRAERDLVSEGKSVLEDRRDLLAHMLVEYMQQTEQLIAEIGVELQRTGRLFRHCVMRHGVSGLTRFIGVRKPPAVAPWQLQNRLGVPFLQNEQDALATGDQEPPEGWVVSLELATTLHALQTLLPALLKLATTENNLLRLVDVFRRTQRRVNALEHIVLPELRQTIKEMEDRMDEMERDDLVRSLLIKRRTQARS